MKFYWVTGDDSATKATLTNVHDGVNSFLISATGVGMSPVSRRFERGPFQDGVTDRGYRLEPRTIQVALLLKAATMADVDALRDDLADILAPQNNLALRVERDDGEFRQIDCAVMDIVDYPITLTDARMGASQTVAITLFCPDPLWYDPTDSGGSMTIVAYDWWTALGRLDTGLAVQKATNITTDSSAGATFSGLTVLDGDPFTIYVRATKGAVTSGSTLFEIEGQSALSPNKTTWRAYYSSGDIAILSNTYNAGSAVPISWEAFLNTATATHYFYVFGPQSPGYVTADTRVELKAVYAYVDSSPSANVESPYRLELIVPASQRTSYGVSSGQWYSTISKGSDWVGTISHAAIFNKQLTLADRESLVTNVRVNAGVLTATKEFSIDYQGNAPEYPVIEVRGRVTNLVLTNVTTGEKLDFTGTDIAANTTRIIDCRYGYKTIKNGQGTNKISELVSSSHLATFHLKPNTINNFSFTGTNTSGDTAIYMTYRNRYLSL